MVSGKEHAESVELFVGLDLGTSGCRAVAVDRGGAIRARAEAPLPAPERNGAASQQAPKLWWEAACDVLDRLFAQVNGAEVRALAVDGTSGTVFLADEQGQPRSPALMYNDGRAVEEMKLLAAVAPRESAAHGVASGLAKLLWLLPRHGQGSARVHTQADWIASALIGRWGVCDTNNALKLGYDPIARAWPAWMDKLPLPRQLLPEVVEASTPLGPLAQQWATRWGLPGNVQVCAGTTDSTAAFLATGTNRPGEAVTSLGSTLVLKVIAEKPAFAPEFGVYSQPLGKLWLVGGGSNSGGAVLRHFFSDARMRELTPFLQPEHSTRLDYYPLLGPGERFPFNDPKLAPRLTPRPADDALFFQGLLEGIAAIEQRGYRLLEQLGAPYPCTVRTAGGGAANAAWTAIRARLLGVPIVQANQTDAAYGTAFLARQGILSGEVSFWP